MRVAAARLAEEARSALGPWIAELGPWHLFGGLTFDPKRVDTYQVRVGSEWRTYWRPPSWIMPKDMAARRLWEWLEGAERALGRRVECVAGLEAHRNGWPHVHPLLRLEGGLQRDDVVTLGSLWYERNGFGRLEAPRSVEQVTAYCAKYLTKDVRHCDLLLKLDKRTEAVIGGAVRPFAEWEAYLASLDGRVDAASTLDTGRDGSLALPENRGLTECGGWE